MGGYGLRSSIITLVRQYVGLRMSELAEKTGAAVAEVRSACWALTNSEELDYCPIREDGRGGGYFTLPAPAKPPGVTAKNTITSSPAGRTA